MRKELCLCESAAACKASLSFQTQITILMHHREQYLTTNTARLATLCIPNCDLYLRGRPNDPLQLSELIAEHSQPLFLYPSENAHVLSKDYLEQFKKPIQLIVPDGSWRQASKVANREIALQGIPRVTLPTGQISEYKLRREPKENGLATFEAIARALGIIEEESVHDALIEIFRVMVKRTLQSRGVPSTQVFPIGNPYPLLHVV
jgi:DTW domain-containing protein YfiP